MFNKAALILTALASLTIANAHAGSAIVVASNGVYAAAWGPLLSAEGAAAKATELCQKKGGIDIKALASAANGSVVGLSRGFGSIAASGHGQSAIVGFSFRLSSGPEANSAALAMCRAKGAANPRIVVAWVERGNGWRDETPGTRVGKL